MGFEDGLIEGGKGLLKHFFESFVDAPDLKAGGSVATEVSDGTVVVAEANGENQDLVTLSEDIAYDIGGIREPTVSETSDFFAGVEYVFNPVLSTLKEVYDDLGTLKLSIAEAGANGSLSPRTAEQLTEKIDNQLARIESTYNTINKDISEAQWEHNGEDEYIDKVVNRAYSAASGALSEVESIDDVVAKALESQPRRPVV